jgi:hypothetical protein
MSSTSPITIPLHINSYWAAHMRNGTSPSWYDFDHWSTDTSIRVRDNSGRLVTCGIAYVGTSGSTRLVHQGPIVPGPDVMIWPSAVAITAWPTGTPTPVIIDLAPGDLINCGGLTFTYLAPKRNAGTDYGRFTRLYL